MKTGIKIDSHKSISKKNDLIIYNKPKKVYIPLICSNDVDLTCEVKINDYVCKGQVIAHRKGNFALPIHSSVSGKVIAFEEHMCYRGDKVKCVVIENDFKETLKEHYEENKKIDSYSKKEFIALLKEGGIRGLGGADFPTYVKYETDNKIKHLIINAVECEPYITSDYALIKEHYEEILEAIDAIMVINDIRRGYIAIKRNNIELINLLNKVIGTYPRIKIVKVPDLYPMGWEKSLVRYILGKDYNGLPSKVGAVINNVSTVYAIYDLLKYRHHLTERIVTITGDMVKKPTNVLVKIGTNINEVLDLVGIKKGKFSYIAGGPMMGTLIEEDELIVSSSLNNVLLLKKGKEDKPLECIRCGKCSNVCPSKLSPVMIKDNIDNIETLKYLEPNRCVECGLCSYVCPAKINVRKYVKEAKGKVKVK